MGSTAAKVEAELKCLGECIVKTLVPCEVCEESQDYIPVYDGVSCSLFIQEEWFRLRLRHIPGWRAVNVPATVPRYLLSRQVSWRRISPDHLSNASDQYDQVTGSIHTQCNM